MLLGISLTIIFADKSDKENSSSSHLISKEISSDERNERNENC
jgi:hypothetical protein